MSATPIAKIKLIKVEMTLEQAKKLGIVFCESCGYPPNNHFDFGKRLCAHTDKCKGYKQAIRLPS